MGKTGRHYNCGKDNPNYGKPARNRGIKPSQETIEKIKKSLIGNKYRLGIPHSEETKKKIGRPGSTNPNWKGGIRMIDGRTYIFSPEHPYADKNGCVLRSRLVVESHIHRFLGAKEKVHHINQDKLDDRVENLWVCTQSEHVALHNKQRKIKKLGDKNVGIV